MIGYCCISLACKIDGKIPTVNRGMIKKTFLSKGIVYVSELVLLNIKDLHKIIKWNIDNNILLYRMSSDMFPWMSEYELKDLPDFNEIQKELLSIGTFISENYMRVSFHPGPFNVLGSLNENVVKKTIKEINQHAEIMDIMGLDKSTFFPINIHINTTKPTKEDASERFCNNFQLLSDSSKKRLVVENDDGINKYSVSELYNLIYNKIEIPITFDQFHYHHGPKDIEIKDALKLSISTWKTRALTHMSSSKRIEDSSTRITAHADYIYEKIETFDLDFDTEIEAKSKDLALFKYRKDYLLE